MLISIGILIFSFGVGIGFLISWQSYRSKESSGTIFVHKNEEKIVYSLELDDNPENLEFKKVVVFKVNASKENLNRD